MPKLICPPEKEVRVTDGEEVLANKLDGGSSRMRRDILGSSSLVEAQWTCDADKFQYLRAFFRTVTVSGSLPFTIDLRVDKPERTEHTARFVPGTMETRALGKTFFQVTARLEIEPIEPDAEYDAAFVAMFEAFGGGSDDISLGLDLLEKLVNVDLPAISPP